MERIEVVRVSDVVKDSVEEKGNKREFKSF